MSVTLLLFTTRLCVEKRRNKLNDLFLAKQIGLVLKDSKMVQNLKGLFQKVKNFGVFFVKFWDFWEENFGSSNTHQCSTILVSTPQTSIQHR
jgi:hypothetical protein